MIKVIRISFFTIALLVFLATNAQSPGFVLRPSQFKHYVDYFNTMEDEPIVQAIPNNESWNWMQQNIPLFESPDKNFEQIFYYRWWTLRKHIKKTEHGYVFTEFLVQRSYADKYNLISSALGHHIYEARWLHDKKYLDDNILIWYRGNRGKPMNKLRAYSNWAIDATYNRFLVNCDTGFVKNLYPDFVDDFKGWQQEKERNDGLYWQFDVRDAMEETISGGRREKNPRPSINGYMFGNAMALSKLAEMNGKIQSGRSFALKADSIKKVAQQKLWCSKHGFFEVRKEAGDTIANVMEEIGFIPWYFNLPDAKYNIAWNKLMDPKHFTAPAGITTADRNHPQFRTHGCCKCEWDGAVWPFATSQTLTAMANLLNNYKQSFVTKNDYFKQLHTYTKSQHRNSKPYIGEYMDEKTGEWLTDDKRGRYYNHSTYNDLIITGLIGLRPRADNFIEVNPLLPAGKWDWFCLDNVSYHGNIITIIWDKTGRKYKKGKGLTVWNNGRRVASRSALGKLVGRL